MNENEMTLTGLIQIPQESFRRLWRLGEGDALLVYLFFLQNNRLPEVHDETMLSMERIAKAKILLEELGLISQQMRTHLAQEAPPKPTQEDIRSALEDEGFHWLTIEAERLLGKIMSHADLSSLWQMYTWYGLPAEVLVQMISFVIEEWEHLYGEGKNPTLRKLKATAIQWDGEGIYSLDLAERYIAEKKKYWQLPSQWMEWLELSPSQVTKKERSALNAWIDWAFPDALIQYAIETTYANTEAHDIAYAHTILSKWHTNSVKTLEEAKTFEAEFNRRRRRTPSKRKVTQAIQPPGEWEDAAMRRLIEESADEVQE
jgi:DnaD/phage-associated family protein